VPTRHPFSELATAAYCPRQLYYRRRDDADVPSTVSERRDLAFAYDRLLGATDAELAAEPIAVDPERYRTTLARSKRSFEAVWDELTAPAERDRLVTGRECRGVVHKVLSLDTPVPSVLSAGRPPDSGAWRPQRVRAVAAAKALSWAHRTSVERAFVEYPAYGAVREVRLTTRRKTEYRSAVRTVESIDGPPPRLSNREKCGACAYRERCGVKTRSLRSLL